MNLNLALLALVIVQPSIAHPSRTTLLQKRFVADLADELKSRVRTLERPILVYHYGNRGTAQYSSTPSGQAPEQTLNTLKINEDEAIDLKRNGNERSPVEINPPEASDYFRAMAGMFQEHKVKWMVGPGLYGAVDPVQSESYAGNPWFLLEISMPKGSRYLDLRPFNGLIVGQKFVTKWLDEASVVDIDSVDLFRIDQGHFLLEWKDILRKPSLRELVNRAMKSLKVDEIAYAWGSHTTALCIRRTLNDRIAFNFVNPEALERGVKLKLFVQELETDASSQKRAEYSRLLDKIEMSRIFYRIGYQKDAKPEVVTDQFSKMIIEQSKMRLYTLAWAKPLDRPSLFGQSLLTDEGTSELLNYYVNRKCNASGAANVSTSCSQPLVSVNLAALQELPVPTEPDANYVYRQFYLDPLSFLQKTRPEEYQKRLKQIETDTFGCSGKPEFEIENEPPGLNN